MSNVPTLSVVIPVFNESAGIDSVVNSVTQVAVEHGWEVIFVDDGSSDDSATRIRSKIDGGRVRLISHPYNRGYVAALKTGIRAASGTVVATMDSDGQHDPIELLRLIPLTKEYDLVVGRRNKILHSKLWRMPGKWILGRLANYLAGRKIPDLNSGMRLFKRDIVLKYLHLCSDGFSFSTTTTLVFFSRGYSVAYEPIEIRPRSESTSSTVSVTTGFQTVLLIMRLASLFRPLSVFVPVSLFFLLAGTAWGVPYVWTSRGVSVGSLLLIMTGLLTFFFGLLADQVAQLRLEKYE
jgi:glycosyltransferase involved in cell wall biosynthesis